MPAGGNSRFRGYPARMSERQQLALLLQMTSQEIVSPGNKSETPQSSSRTSIGQRGSKNRWPNKNGASPAHRKEDSRRDLPVTIDNDLERGPKNSHEAANPSDEPSPDSPRSTSPEIDNQGQSSVNQQTTSSPQNYQHQQRPVGNTSAGVTTDAEESGAPCEMRRTPPQNKVDRSGSGQSGSSPRVTLRLNQVRGTRDEKKNTCGGSRQSVSGSNPSPMDSTSKTPSSTTVSSSSSTTTTTTSHPASSNPPAGTGTSSTADNSDVYEFKSSKEATPVRGTSVSPNPNPEKEKEGSKTSGGQTTAADANTTSSGDNTSTTTSLAPPGGVETPATGSPSSKRAYEGDNDEQDEENRRKKRKESEPAKDTKSTTSGRQTTSRAASTAAEKSDKVASSVNPSSFVEQCAKTSKPGSTTTGKSPATTNTTNSDRKSPNSTVSASSPKPSSTGGSGPNSKTGTPAPPAESDGEEDRPKSSDSSSAPKVPPLKIVIPQSTAEQEQGNRNGKSASTRGHQLPYVVASSNSNDSTDKDQGTTASGTTSPTEAASTAKVEDKKDFSGAIHSEERSTHHQRVLRSSHRSGNGGNGTAASKESASAQSGNGNYANSSPLPAAASADRSNNSSPQQRNNSPSPETTSSEPTKTTTTESTTTSSSTKTIGNVDKADKNETSGKNQKDSNENSENSSSSTSTTNNSTGNTSAPVELHPRKRKMKPSKEAQQAAATAASNESSEATNTGTEVHPHDQPITNCYQLFLNIRQQIERRRKGLFPVQPKPPQGFKDYLMNRCTYVLAGNAKEPNINTPIALQALMKDLYVEQEKERYRLRMQHVVEKEKLVLSVEQEILRVHGRAARALANQSLPFSVCTILKDEEVYNVITPEQEEKDRNARSRYNGRLFLSWLQDVDDKWEKIKEAMLLRHHNEAESLHAVQKMDWEWKLKEVGLCEFKAAPQMEDIHVPMVHVSDDFDLLPA